ncbi:MAG: dihydrolipoamide acetyltransferase family protein [Thermoleophilia bacterium]
MATTSAIDVVMPQMGVSVSEGTITKWLKQEGEEIAADEPLLEISTDKVDTEVPSPGDGVVQQILVQEGETVEVGTKLAVIAPAGAEAPAAEAEPEPEPEPEAVPEPATAQAAAESSAVSDAPGTPTTADEVEEATPAPAEASATTGDDEPAPAPAAAPAPSVQGPSTNGKTFVSPVVARIAAENNIDPSQVPGTGQGGRVTKKDILNFIESGAQAEPQTQAPTPPPAPAEAPPAEAPAPPPAPAAAAPAPAPAAQAEPVAQGESEEPMSAMRRGIAEHMRRSLDTSAHVTSAIEVDMTKVVGIREKLKKEYQATYGVNPTYLSFIARAAVETLKDYPWINGELRGDKIVTRSFVNLGFAVELADGKGLIVPVIKNAETLNLLGMAKSVAEIAERARNKQLTPDDVTGGTFTITNPGGYGTFHGTPVISQPQAGILGTYAIVKRPWVVQDEFGKDAIAIRSMMNLTLTYDHRLVDGALAGRFLRDLREKLQTWGEPDY